VFLALRGFNSVMGWGRAGFEGDVGLPRVHETHYAFEPRPTRTHDVVQTTAWLEHITSLQLARSDASFEQRSAFLPRRGLTASCVGAERCSKVDVGLVRLQETHHALEPRPTRTHDVVQTTPWQEPTTSLERQR
jgi:hypothetical protein